MIRLLQRRAWVGRERGPGGVRVCVALLLSTLAAPTLRAQPEAAPPPPAQGAPSPAASVVAPAPEAGLYRGPASCASSTCHGGTRPREVFDVLQNEYFTWLQRDPHSKAHEVLYGEGSRRIAANLGLTGEAAEAPVCLACHAFVPPAEEISGDLSIDDGISCEACHGPASGWLGGHTEEGWTRAASVAAGMRDVSGPVSRGELCLGCHLGDSERRVDHRLLAAGHPRLTFELDNYGERVQHWRPEPPGEVARVWAVGQAVALKEDLDRVIAAARGGPWPELALLSCEDCHHSLAEERWRGPRGRRPGLGLPRWSPARWVVLGPLVGRFAPGREAALGGALERLSGSLARLASPPAETARAAEEAGAELAQVLPALEAAEWDETTLTAVLADLTGDGGRMAGADHAAAEQIFWAVNTLASSLVRLRPEVLRGGLPDAVERLYAAVQSPYRWDREGFTDALERLRREVRRLR